MITNLKADRPGGSKLEEFAPIEMLVLQGTSYCNLNCSYCYLSEASRRNKSRMDASTIEQAFERVLSSPFVGDRLRVSWHSGEPLVLPVSYYREAIEIATRVKEKVRPEVDLSFDIQTNGTLISQEWCDFIKSHDGKFLIGVSCDGPENLHDIHRKNWSGRSSHRLTHEGMLRLAENGIRFDVTAVVSPESLARPDEFLDHFAQFSSSINEFHFNLHDEIFIDPDDDEKIESYSQLYQQFIQRLLTKICGASKGHYPKIRNISSFYNRLFVDEQDRPQYDADTMSKPFRSLSVEANGDVTTFYAGLTVDECGDLKDLYGDAKGFVIGNICSQSLEEMAASPKLARIKEDFRLSHETCRQRCQYVELCSGGYNLIKQRRFGRFDVAETPECRVHVKAFADKMLSHIAEELER